MMKMASISAPHLHDPATRIISPARENTKEFSSIILRLISHEHRETLKQTSVIHPRKNNPSELKVLSGVLVGNERSFHLWVDGWRDGAVETLMDANGCVLRIC